MPGHRQAVQVHSERREIFPFCQGDLTSNWEFFKQRWDDYEIATGLRNQESQVRLATLRSMMGRECLQILKNLGLSEEQFCSVVEVLSTLQRYFRPQKNVVSENASSLTVHFSRQTKHLILISII